MCDCTCMSGRWCPNWAVSFSKKRVYILSKVWDIRRTGITLDSLRGAALCRSLPCEKHKQSMPHGSHIIIFNFSRVLEHDLGFWSLLINNLKLVHWFEDILTWQSSPKIWQSLRKCSLLKLRHKIQQESREVVIMLHASPQYRQSVS